MRILKRNMPALQSAIARRGSRIVLEKVVDERKITTEEMQKTLNQLQTILDDRLSIISKSIRDTLYQLTVEKESDKREMNTLQSVEVTNFPPQKDIVFPTVQEVKGQVRIENQVDLSELKELSDKFEEVVKAVKDIRFPAQKEVKFPEIKFPSMPTSISLNETTKIIDALTQLREAIDEVPKRIVIPETIFPSSIHVNNFPPQKYPMPVTHMNINPLQGYMKSTAVTVGTSATALPTTPLAYRRSMSIYNNSSTVTLYIGGSDVTTANGVPIPPLSSDAFDAGGKLIVYGITSSTADIRVLELSTDEYTRGTPNV